MATSIKACVNMLTQKGFNITHSKECDVHGVEYRHVFLTDAEGVKADVFGMGGKISCISFTQGFYYRTYKVNTSDDIQKAFADYVAA